MEVFADPLDGYLTSVSQALDRYPELEHRLGKMLSERRKNVQAKATQSDMDAFLNADLREPVEDDRQPSLTAEYYQTIGGLDTPDAPRSIEDRLRALWNAPRKSSQLNLTAEQDAYRRVVGDLFTPEA